MPNKQDHQDRANHNERFFSYLCTECARTLQALATELAAASARVLILERAAEREGDDAPTPYAEIRTKLAEAKRALTAQAQVTRQFPDWMATGVFYAAVHLVDALLANRGIHPRGHTQRGPAGAFGRNDYVQRLLRPIYPDYRELYNLSRTARYYPQVCIGQNEVSQAIDVHYAAVKKHILPLL